MVGRWFDLCLEWFGGVTCAVPDTTTYCLKASRRLFRMGSPSNKNDPQEVLHATDQQPQKFKITVNQLFGTYVYVSCKSPP